MDKTFSFCLGSPVLLCRGHSRSTIMNTASGTYDFIPNALCDLLQAYNKLPVQQVFEELHEDNHPIVEEYFAFLLKHRYIFLTREPHLYPELGRQWFSNYALSNAILDFNPSLSYSRLIEELSGSGCRAIQLRVFDKMELDALKGLVAGIELSRIKDVQIIFPYCAQANAASCLAFFSCTSKLSTLYIYGAPENRQVFADESLLRSCVYSTSKVLSEKSCGIIHPDYFVQQADAVHEALHHNTCLNRKVSIDREGNIKNCPSLPQAFGNISHTTLTEALGRAGFKDLWNIRKDDIKVCRDCEFRYMCSDCRAYLEQPDDVYSKPLKCGYDPYANRWEEWSKHPLKQKAILFYGLKDFRAE